MNRTLKVCVATAALMLAVAVEAAGPFNDQPAGPQSLPGDLLPPFAMLNADGELPPPPPLPEGGIHGDPPAEPVAGPDLDLATALARAAVDACASEGFLVGAAVIDSAGEPRAMLIAEGSHGSVFVAMRKALVAREFGVASSLAAAMVDADPAQLERVTPAMFVVGGGVPIIRDGSVIGALGVSGAAGPVIGAQDEACANAALASHGL